MLESYQNELEQFNLSQSLALTCESFFDKRMGMDLQSLWI